MKEMSRRLTGVIVPMVTPFDEKENLDENALRQLTRWLIDRRVTGVYPESGCGEVWKLSLEERLRVIEIVGEEAKGKTLFIPGTGAGSTRETIALTQHAGENGADACVVWPPTPPIARSPGGWGCESTRQAWAPPVLSPPR